MLRVFLGLILFYVIARILWRFTSLFIPSPKRPTKTKAKSRDDKKTILNGGDYVDFEDVKS